MKRKHNNCMKQQIDTQKRINKLKARAEDIVQNLLQRVKEI